MSRQIAVEVSETAAGDVPRPADERIGDWVAAALEAADAELMRRIAALVEPRHRGKWEPWPEERAVTAR